MANRIMYVVRILREGRCCSPYSIITRTATTASIDVPANVDTSAQEYHDTKEKDMPLSDMPNPFQRDKMQCVLCKYNLHPDYKNVKLLSQFVSLYTGRIYGRHITRLCKEQQKRVQEEIVKAQSAGFMAYYFKDVSFLKDPKLFNPEQPFRPHRF